MTAIISDDGLYRYELWRELGGDGPIIGWCLHNPSTADGEQDDPTSRRGIAFSQSWGACRMVFINPWAGRATKKSDLWKMRDPVGPDNDKHIATVARECAESGGFVVLAWGAINDRQKPRIRTVKALIAATGCEIRALGFTDAGHPRHPLYLRSDTTLVQVP